MNFPEIENKILKFWEKEKVFDKLRQKNKGKKRWSFLDGPITANNPMGVHHAWGRTYKDVFQRYKAMQGFEQRFQNGFDCQGLWVEVEVEKELGFKSKKDIEKYGIAKFVEKCKERVHKYSMLQTKQSIRLGQWCDWGEWQTELNDPDWLKKAHSYFTMSDENNYAIWHFLKKCHQQGLLYKGRDSVPWCPRCGTSISQHEILTEDYKEIVHQAVYVKYKVCSNPTAAKGGGRVAGGDTYFLVWTTTPWTLPGNVALAVHPDFDYIIAKLKIKRQKSNLQGKSQKLKKEERVILLKDEVDILGDGYEIEKTIKGKELEGMEYEGLFDGLPAVAKTMAGLPVAGKELNSFHNGRSLTPSKHQVILWKEVSQEEGTGIVHIAPGCGAEDYQLSKELGLPVIDLSDDESKYREGFGDLSGKFVGSKDVRDWIFEYLEKGGKQKQSRVFKIEAYKHRYPICWRCKTELIFRLVDEWYISMGKPLKLKVKSEKLKVEKELREGLIESAKKIKWIPSFGLDRELDWLKNMRDWLISKKRYWGLALPIFECEKCGHFEVIGSKQELKEKAVDPVRNGVSNGVDGWDKFDPPAGGHSPHRPWLDEVKIKCSKCGAKVSRIKDVGTPWLDAGIVPFSTISDDNRADDIPYFQDAEKGRAEWQKWFPIDFITESFPGQFKNWFYVLLVMSQVLENQPPFKTLLGFASVVDEKGEEMHKSKGNAIWFNDAVEKIGADVMRWMYVKQNPVYNMRFGYNAAKETARKLLTLVNCYTFFETYGLRMSNVKCQMSNQIQMSNVKNILDKWILSRLNGLIAEVTKSMDKFDAMRASQAIEDFFINDLSLWYIRRSRKRVDEASPVLYFVLLGLAKLIAPMMPFLAEELYQKIRLEDGPLSVHLCDWPEAGKEMINKESEQQMAHVREIVSMALAKRTELGIRVRQPLQKLKVKSQKLNLQGKSKKFLKEVTDLIKDEVNIKEVVFDEKMKEQVELDAKITEELKQEGQVREIIRQVQALRKKAGLTPQDKDIVLHYFGGDALIKLLKKNKKEIAEQTNTKKAKENQDKKGKFLAQSQTKVDSQPLWLALAKT